MRNTTPPKILPVALLFFAFAFVLAFALAPPADAQEERETRLVLVLVDELSWEDVNNEPRLLEVFESGASANLSTAQGGRSEDARMGYISLGAGARVDARTLPDRLPQDRDGLLDAFTGPAATVVPGSLGAALEGSNLTTAAVGKRAELVVMDEIGGVPNTYDDGDPASGTLQALEAGADLAAVEAEDAREAAEVIEIAEDSGVAVAVCGPNAPREEAALTPVVISDGDERPGLLYSPSTRTGGLITNADVAPTILSKLGVNVETGDFQGRVARVGGGDVSRAESLGERMAFVSESRYVAWGVVVGALAVFSLVALLRRGGESLRPALLTLAALPVGAQLAAATPTVNVPVAAAVILVSSFALAALALKFTKTLSGALAVVLLVVAAVVALDAAAGGALMKVSVLGYDPAYGARFYGVGNEMSAVLAGSLTMGLGALRAVRRLSPYIVAAVGAAVVLVLALPMMGADVGGALALGFGLGVTVGILYTRSLVKVAVWTLGGSLFAALVLLASGLFFPDVSHGSRAVSDGGGLPETLLRKILISLDILTFFPLLILLATFCAIIFFGWRKVRGTPLAAGMLGAFATALASGAINDSGIVSTLFVLVYPAIAALLFLIPPENENPESRKR